MTVVRTRTFCCCIPVRGGVVIIALIGLFGGAALAAVGGVEAKRMAGSKAALAISVTVYSLLAAVSLLGLIGAISRRLNLIKMYFGMLLAHLIFSIGIGGYAIFRAFRDAPGFLEDCLNSDVAKAADDPDKVCANGVNVVKGVTLTLFIVLWLFEIWGCVIVSNYSKQLADEKAVQGVVKDTEAW